MYDGNKVLIGLGLFVLVFGYPFYNNLGKSYKAPELPKAAKEPCVEDPKWMRANHMKLLDEWRHASTRDGERLYVSFTNGKTWTASLQRTCMDCHTSQKDFCTKCHDANGVHPFCWDCHVPPKEKAAAGAAKADPHAAPAAKPAEQPKEKKGHE